MKCYEIVVQEKKDAAKDTWHTALIYDDVCAIFETRKAAQKCLNDDDFKKYFKTKIVRVDRTYE